MSTLVQRIQDLATAINNKFNLVTPRLAPTGGTPFQVLAKNTSANNDFSWYNVSVLTGNLVTALPANNGGVYEWSETLVANGMVVSPRVYIALAPEDDTQENGPEMLDIKTLTAACLTANTVTVYLTFSEPTSGTINLIYGAI